MTHAVLLRVSTQSRYEPSVDRPRHGPRAGTGQAVKSVLRPRDLQDGDVGVVVSQSICEMMRFGRRYERVVGAGDEKAWRRGPVDEVKG